MKITIHGNNPKGEKPVKDRPEWNAIIDKQARQERGILGRILRGEM